MSGTPPSSPSSRSTSSREHRESSSSKDSAPPGIYVIAIIGGIVSLLGVVLSLAIMGQGGGWFLVGLVLLVLNAAQLYVLVGLVRLDPWAWTWALVLYGLAALIDLFSVDILGLLVTLVIIVYIYSKADYYDR